MVRRDRRVSRPPGEHHERGEAFVQHPRQLVEQGMRLEVHGRQLDTSALEMKDHIQDPNHLYYCLASLDKIHNGFPTETKLADRKIADFPNTSVAVLEGERPRCDGRS